MKLLHIISSLEIGGAQRLLADLLPIQIQHGLEVDLLVNVQIENDFTEKIKEFGINIMSLDSNDIYSVSNIIKLRRIIRSYDVVHVHLFPSLYWAAIASVGLKVKMIYTEHSTSNRRREKSYFRLIEKYIYKRYDRIISISRQTENALQQWLQSSDKRFVVIENGVDTRRFSAICRPVVPKSLIMVSRFAASKDQETLIRSMKYLDKDVVLHLVGDGDNLEYCRSIAKNEGVSDRVMFLGARSDIAELISEAYIGIQSSNWEGFGLTAVEIMAAGKPVIVSDVDGLKQVVEGAGEIFHKGNARELALKISHLLEDKSYYEAIAANCKCRAACYDIELMAGKYENIYYELMKG
ncbi:MAG: glycosyltransferase family 4 protein [Bacteroidales bacterium]|nr:glycosyltransferase family 4 protein [Bacteroidales bacterium]